MNFTRGSTVLAQARATGLTGGTTLTVPFPTAATAIAPNLPGLSARPVQAPVYVQTGTLTYALIGSVPLTITDTRPRAPSLDRPGDHLLMIAYAAEVGDVLLLRTHLEKLQNIAPDFKPSLTYDVALARYGPLVQVV